MTAHDPTGRSAGDAWDEHLVDDQDLDDTDVEVEDFDAYWAEQRAQIKPRMARIRGVLVTVPTSLPLHVNELVHEMQHSKDPDDVAEVVSALFGEDTYDAWVDARMGADEFRVVLAWGMANGNGKAMTFAETTAMIEEAERSQGKARAAASSGTRGSGAGGGSSSRTSGASTASQRRRSGTSRRRRS
ncbi:hypothetical protein [Actinokineospora sp.]|uniref:hypothetical protein n=1 Tax=Actinokineospora sp. TaxID=1872133 RepID=UPI003D6A5B0D